MRVWLLGTAGWMPTQHRETTCLATRSGDSLLIFDAGTGLSRLASPEMAHLVDGAKAIHLFLTHYHLDHTCGLAYLPGLFPGRSVAIHAPSIEFTGIDPTVALSGLLRRPYNPRNLSELTSISVEPAGRETVVAGHRVRARAQQHSDVSVAYRLDDEFVLATDTTADLGTSEFAAGVGVLLHEAWYRESDLATLTDEVIASYAAHSEAGAAARLAARAGVSRLVLIHLSPLRDEDYYEAMADAARKHFPATSVVPDAVAIETSDGNGIQ